MLKHLTNLIRNRRAVHVLHVDRIRGASPAQKAFAQAFIEHIYNTTGEVTEADCITLAHTLQADKGDLIAWAGGIGEAGRRQAVEAVRQLVNAA